MKAHNHLSKRSAKPLQVNSSATSFISIADKRNCIPHLLGLGEALSRHSSTYTARSLCSHTRADKSKQCLQYNTHHIDKASIIIHDARPKVQQAIQQVLLLQRIRISQPLPTNLRRHQKARISQPHSRPTQISPRSPNRSRCRGHGSHGQRKDRGLSGAPFRTFVGRTRRCQ